MWVPVVVEMAKGLLSTGPLTSAGMIIRLDDECPQDCGSVSACTCMSSK